MAKSILEKVVEERKSKGKLGAAMDALEKNKELAQNFGKSTTGKTLYEPQAMSAEELAEIFGENPKKKATPKKQKKAKQSQATSGGETELSPIAPEEEVELSPIAPEEVEDDIMTALRTLSQNLQDLQNRVKGMDSSKQPSRARPQNKNAEPISHDFEEDSFAGADMRSIKPQEASRDSMQRAKAAMGGFLDSNADVDLEDKVSLMGHLYLSLNNMMTQNRTFSYGKKTIETTYLAEIAMMASVFARGEILEAFSKDTARIKLSSNIVKQFLSDVADLARKHHYYTALYRE